ncbi:TetR family transcriptional regulator [Nakamurella silvestris]|nr:TetR family transcriptional regulator [Nakamurella silvestris]
MSQHAESAAPGLRERKKIRTRATIRVEAMRLFRENGYSSTTVEQIAEAAEVSPSTFFRYYPTKEALVLTDDLDPLVVRALANAPTGVSALTAVRMAFVDALAGLDERALLLERERQALVASEPDLRSAMLDDFRRNLELIADAMAVRTGRAADSFEVRVFAGAVIGAVQGSVDMTSNIADQVTAALEYLEQGLPL